MQEFEWLAIKLNQFSSKLFSMEANFLARHDDLALSGAEFPEHSGAV